MTLKTVTRPIREIRHRNLINSALKKPSITEVKGKNTIVDRFIKRENLHFEHRMKLLADNEKAIKEGTIPKRQPFLKNSKDVWYNPNPFHAYKNHLTGKWLQSRYSLRREADLVKGAYREGRLEELFTFLKEKNIKPGKKFDKAKKRLAELVKTQSGTSTNQSLSLYSQGYNADLLRQIKADQDHDKMKLASQFAITQGPYRGRNPERPFKGTKRQRLAPTKRARILQSMTAMPEIIAKFRQRVAAEKAAKPPKILPGQL